MRLSTVAILFALLGLTYLMGATLFVERIEQDITNRSNAAARLYQPEVSVLVDGRDITLHGTVGSEAIRQQIHSKMASIWGVRATANQLEVKPSSYDFSATFSNNHLQMDGSVDSGKAINALASTAAAMAPGISSRQSVSPGAPQMPDSVAKLRTGVTNLTRLIDGRLHIDSNEWTLHGLAEDPTIRNEIETDVAAKQKQLEPLAVTVDLDVNSLVSGACQSKMQHTADGVVIHFDSASTTVKPEYMAQLRRFAKLPNNCSGKLLIEAHADQDGSEQYNLELSKRRATAVKKYLVKMGAEPASIHSFAYGEVRAVASNESSPGKSGNRRVELHFIQSLDAVPLKNKPSFNVSLQSAE